MTTMSPPAIADRIASSSASTRCSVTVWHLRLGRRRALTCSGWRPMICPTATCCGRWRGWSRAGRAGRGAGGEGAAALVAESGRGGVAARVRGLVAPDGRTDGATGSDSAGDTNAGGGGHDVGRTGRRVAQAVAPGRPRAGRGGRPRSWPGSIPPHPPDTCIPSGPVLRCVLTSRSAVPPGGERQRLSLLAPPTFDQRRGLSGRERSLSRRASSSGMRVAEPRCHPLQLTPKVLGWSVI